MLDKPFKSEHKIAYMSVFAILCAFLLIALVIPLVKTYVDQQEKRLMSRQQEQFDQYVQRTDQLVVEKFNHVDHEIKKMTHMPLENMHALKETMHQEIVSQAELMNILVDYKQLANTLSMTNFMTMDALSQVDKPAQWNINVMKQASDYVMHLNETQLKVIKTYADFNQILEPLCTTLMRTDETTSLVEITTRYLDEMTPEMKLKIRGYLTRVIVAYGDSEKARKSYVYKFYQQLKGSSQGEDKPDANDLFLQSYLTNQQSESIAWDTYALKFRGHLIAAAVLNSSPHRMDLFPTSLQKNASRFYQAFLKKNRSIIIHQLDHPIIKKTFAGDLPKKVKQTLPKWMLAALD
ncbi:MAG: hypothetical protein CMF42_03420 [Legionellales bacterium]|nr:hypothetical protein [Legionellales bacterium]